MTARRLPLAFWALMLGSLVLAGVLLFDLAPILRGGELFRWQWPVLPAEISRLWPLTLLTLLYTAGAWRLRRARPVAWLSWAMLGGVALSLAVVYAHENDVLRALFLRTVSRITVSTHAFAAEINTDLTTLSQWPEVMRAYHGDFAHVTLSPPGLILLQEALTGLFAAFPALSEALQRALMPYQCHNYALLSDTPAQWASALPGMLMPVWASLTVLPLAWLAHQETPESAPYAVLLWPLVPALTMFAPTWNTLYPLGVALSCVALVKGLRGGAGWLMLAGGLYGALTFANFAIVPVAGLAGFYTLLKIWWPYRDGAAFRRAVVIGAWYGLGALLPWLMFFALTGVTPLDILRASFDQHLALDRPYLPWLGFHFWEWAVMTGVPVIALWLWHSRHAGAIWGQALMLTMLVLLLSGTARGETGRLWVIFAPFVLLSAAGWLNASARPGRAFAALLIAQGGLLIALAGTWDVIDAPDLRPPPAKPPIVEASRPGGAVVNEAFALLNWDASVSDEAITLRFNWQTERQMVTPLWFGALLVQPDGTPAEVPPTVWQARQTAYPTTCWSPGDIVSDVITLPLPENVSAGGWWVSLSVFPSVNDPEARWHVMLPDGTPDQQIPLGPITINPRSGGDHGR